MNIHRYNPRGRLRAGDKTEIEIVSEPDAAWFRRCTPVNERGRIVRFALMTDGTLYFGDAYHVLHWDICQARSTSKDGIETGPIVVGSMCEMPKEQEGRYGFDGMWHFSTAQLFGQGVDDDVLTTTRGLLRALKVWPSIVEALGQTDPTELVRCGEDKL